MNTHTWNRVLGTDNTELWGWFRFTWLVNQKKYCIWFLGILRQSRMPRSMQEWSHGESISLKNFGWLIIFIECRVRSMFSEVRSFSWCCRSVSRLVTGRSWGGIVKGKWGKIVWVSGCPFGCYRYCEWLKDRFINWFLLIAFNIIWWIMRFIIVSY